MGDIYIQAREQTSRYGHCQEAVFENDGQAKKDLQEKRQGALLDPEH